MVSFCALKTITKLIFTYLIFLASVGHFVAWKRNNINNFAFLISFTHQVEIFGPSSIQLKINNVLKPDLVSVVTAHIVYFLLSLSLKI